MTRRKAPAQVAPQTLEEAVALLTRYSLLSAELAATEATVKAAVAAVLAEAAPRVERAEADLKDIVRQMKPWWAVAGAEITEGKRKSAELAGCLIGERTSNPKLAFAGKAIDKHNEDAAIAAVEAADGLDHFLRVVTELDKQLLLRAIANDDADVLALGFTARQREEFFIDWMAPKAPPTVEVPAAPEELAA